ncbi:MAG: hypothetical protein Q9M40_11260 [Sulfurimonas sp.]|nr:hypothetical protein [Sulfurimonas sp.]
MKAQYMISLAVATAIFTGCGGESTNTTPVVTAITTDKTINVQRGPILGAIVLDASGQIASEDVNGSYTFANTPTYPIVASGGVIDVDRNGVVNPGDVANDLNLTTVSGSVVTMATTFYANPKTRTMLESFKNDLNLTIEDLKTKTPSDSKEIEAISNMLYKYVKDNNISDLLDTNSTLLADINDYCSWYCN